MSTENVIPPFADAYCSALDGRDVAQVMGALFVLSATCAATPSMLIKRLTGCLWADAEASDLLAAASCFKSINDRIINDLVNRPNDERSDGGPKTL